jgi:hypothetical protein
MITHLLQLENADMQVICINKSGIVNPIAAFPTVHTKNKLLLYLKVL